MAGPYNFPVFGKSAPTSIDILRAAVLAAVFGVIALSGIELTREGGRIAALWLPNAVLGAVLLRTQSGHGLRFATCFIANFVVNLLVGDHLTTALFLASSNMVEIAVFVGMVRRTCGPSPAVDQISTLGWLLIASVVSPAISGIIAATHFAVAGSSFVSSFTDWILADALGLVIIAPVTMIGIDAWRDRKRPTRRELWDWFTLLAGASIATSAIFAQSHFPFLFLACPIVIAAAFQRGLRGTAAAIAVISIIAPAATMMGHGPIMLVKGDLGAKLLALQLFLATSFAMGLPVASLLAAHASIRRKLQTSHDFVQSIVDNVQDVIFRTDAEGRWVFLNPAWETITGYSVDESLGWFTTRLLHDDDRAAAASIYADVAAGKLVKTRIQQRFWHANGDCRSVEVTVRALFDENNEFAGTTGNINDITDDLRQKRALFDSEQRFRQMAEAAPVGIFQTDVEGRCSYVNPAWRKLSGLGPDDWQDHGWSSALHPEDRVRVFEGWAAAVRDGMNFRGEFRWLRPDGSIAWTDVSAGPERDEARQLTGYTGVTVDITGRRQAEEELAQREAQFALLANNATDAVFRLTLDGLCLYASPSARALLGLDPQLLIGQQMLTRFHPDDAAATLAVFKMLARGATEDTIIAYRSERVGSDGDYRWLEAHCGLVRNENGCPNEVIASIRDVSTAKAMEADLREARVRAEAAVAAKAAFLANMSHEIRTPMNGVVGFTELLSASALTPEQSRHVQLIADSGRAMMRLLNDILDMSKIESGQMKLSIESIDLDHKLRNCIRLLEPMTLTKGIALTLDVHPALPGFIMADPLRLAQILLNLIGNAAKFTEHGSIRVSAKRDDQTLIIAVTDTGIGIAPDRLDLVFQQFAQADGTIARRFGGTGLGLSISVELARLMDGGIDVESVLGEGTTFTLRIPLLETSCRPAAVTNFRDSISLQTVTRRRLRVLVAEDHDINQILICDLARAAGYDPTIVADGALAVAAVHAAADRGEPFDFVLMDVQMPGTDGLAATRQLRADGFGPDRLPICALTANAYAEDVQECLAAGMQAHLAKPVRLRDLNKLRDRFNLDEPVPASAADDTGYMLLPSAGKSVEQRYQERKQETVQAIAQAVRSSRLDGATIDQLAGMLHKLAGTAGFFGDGPLGDIAAQLEHLLTAAAPDDWRAVVSTADEALRDAA